MTLLATWLAVAGSLLAAATFVPGVAVTNFYAALVGAAVLGVLHLFVRPILLALTLPINILTLGLFTFVVNGLLLWFMTSIVKGISVSGFLAAFIVALIVTVVSALVDMLFSK